MSSKLQFADKIETLLDKIDYNKLNWKVGIKLHFGEKWCDTYINPTIAEKLYNKLESKWLDVSMIECNVLYRGSRTNSSDHIRTAKEHGFDFGKIDILDGEQGEKSLKLNVDGWVVTEAKVGQWLEKYDSLVVLSHFKWHSASGFWGAFKNLGMGLGSRWWKLHMHSDISPSVDQSKCTGCWKCIEACDFDAIRMENGVAKIDESKCTGCAMCIAVCPCGAVNIPWSGSSNIKLQKKIVDYSKAIINYFNENIVYINVLENITKDCDCMWSSQSVITDDIGMLLGNDPVAIDKASFDMVKEQTDWKFQSFHNVDWFTQIEYGAKQWLWNKDYKIENV